MVTKTKLPTTLAGWLGLITAAFILLAMMTSFVVGAVSTYLDVKSTKEAVGEMKVELKELRGIVQESNINLAQRVSTLEGKVENQGSK